jgi:hypothetical protein
MARKHTLPGVDEAALSELARQFPSHDVGEPPSPMSGDKPTAEIATASRRPSHLGVAAALLLALLALLVAAVPLGAPYFRAEIGKWIGEGPVVDVLMGSRAGFERELAAKLETEKVARAELGRQLAALASRIDLLGEQAKRADARLAAIEAVGGSSAAAARRVDAAEANVALATSRIAALERDQRAAAEALVAKLAEIGPALAAIEQRATAAVDQRTAGLAEQVAGAAKRTEEVERNFGELRQFNRSSVRLFLIALHLRAAVQTAAPFPREIVAVRSVAGDSAEAVGPLRVLGEHAASGVRTITDLRDAFASNVGAQVKALAVGLDSSWASRLTSIVAGPQVPRGGEGERVWRVVVQAEQFLAQGNLAFAINQVDRFDGPAGAIVADWLRDAKARLAVENAAAALSIYALNQLVGGS